MSSNISALSKKVIYLKNLNTYSYLNTGIWLMWKVNNSFILPTGILPRGKITTNVLTQFSSLISKIYFHFHKINDAEQIKNKQLITFLSIFLYQPPRQRVIRSIIRLLFRLISLIISNKNKLILQRRIQRKRVTTNKACRVIRKILIFN